MQTFKEKLEIQIQNTLKINLGSKKEINKIIRDNLQILSGLINKIEPIEEIDIGFYNSPWTEKINPESELGLALSKTILLFNLYLANLEQNKYNNPLF